MSKSKTYEEFVKKFKPKKTTDDCYTPPLVYEAVADFVAKEYALNKANFVRPFYSGGDYENFDYGGKVVVDNPPFSILAKIIDFYIAKRIKFFLFAPTLTVLSTQRERHCTCIIANAKVTYENGAIVNTSFITNLDSAEIRVRTSPKLFNAIKNANNQNKKSLTKSFSKYEYPPNVITVSKINPLSELKILRNESVRISRLQSQKDSKKAIFGEGLLVSDRVADQVKQATQVNEAKKIVWELSTEETEIIAELNENS